MIFPLNLHMKNVDIPTNGEKNIKGQWVKITPKEKYELFVWTDDEVKLLLSMILQGDESPLFLWFPAHAHHTMQKWACENKLACPKPCICCLYTGALRTVCKNLYFGKASFKISVILTKNSVSMWIRDANAKKSVEAWTGPNLRANRGA